MSAVFAKYRDSPEDDWSTDSSRTDGSSVATYSPTRGRNSPSSVVSFNSDLYKRLRHKKGNGPQLVRHQNHVHSHAPLAVPKTVVYLPADVHIPLPDGVSFDPSTMSFQGITDVDMSGFDDSDDEGSIAEKSSTSEPPPSVRPRAQSTPFARSRTPTPPPRPPSPATSENEKHSSPSEFVVDEAMRAHFLECERRHNVMLLAFVGIEDYNRIQAAGKRMLSKSYSAMNLLNTLTSDRRR